MLIKCPKCGFSRDVAASRLAGGNVRITCPKCDCKFSLAKTGQSQILPNTGNDEEDIHEVARRAYEKEQHRLDNEKNETDPQDRRLPDIPWAEAPGEVGWLSAFIRTVIGIMVQAPVFAGRLKNNAAFGRPLVFYLIICVTQILVEQSWTRAFIDFMNSSAVDDPQLQHLLEVMASSQNLIYSVLFRTAMYVLQLYLVSFLMFAVYSMLAPNKIKFSMVFQILSYGAAPMLLCVIPILGSIAGMIWSVISTAICFQVVTGLDWGKIIAGYLPPLFLLLLAMGQIFNIIAH